MKSDKTKLIQKKQTTRLQKKQLMKQLNQLSEVMSAFTKKRK